jgi:ssDNA-binding Zn-finger/Zn-ribbon topoisomerase 1
MTESSDDEFTWVLKNSKNSLYHVKGDDGEVDCQSATGDYHSLIRLEIAESWDTLSPCDVCRPGFDERNGMNDRCEDCGGSLPADHSDTDLRCVDCHAAVSGDFYEANSIDRAGTTSACPDCDSSKLVHRVSDEYDFDWLCRDCRNEFDSPNERERGSTGGLNPKSLAGQVAAMDSDEIFDDEIDYMFDDEAVYIINRHYTEVYHENENCFELHGVSEITELCADRAKESAHLAPCSACRSSGDTITLCPDCDSPAIRRQTHRWASADASVDDAAELHALSHADFDAWRCCVCGSEFDDPNERVRKSESGRRGLAGRLASADSEEVFDDD